jgi:hypothetical protein
VDNKNYYAKCLAELKKDADTQLRQELVTYRSEIHATIPDRARAGGDPVDSKPRQPDHASVQATTVTAAPASHPDPITPPEPVSPALVELRLLFSCLTECVELIEHRLSTPTEHQRDPSRGRAHKPATPTGPPALVSCPTPSVALPSQQDLWQEVSKCCRQPNKLPTLTLAPLPGQMVSPTKPTHGQHTEIMIQLLPANLLSRTARCDPVVIMCQICTGLRSSGSLLVLLSGQWASASQNFVLTFAGMVPFDTIQRNQVTLA